VSVAQQVEQKETMAIQYTIEMRRCSTRFRCATRSAILFKVWAEVLAVSGRQERGRSTRKHCSEEGGHRPGLGRSAKPNRNDRARVIQDSRTCCSSCARHGADGHAPASEQESHIKIIGDTLAEAFLSKTEAIRTRAHRGDDAAAREPGGLRRPTTRRASCPGPGKHRDECWAIDALR
jgi:hypothetical protein